VGPITGGDSIAGEGVHSENGGRMGGTERGRTAGCLHRTKELEHALALALSGVRAKIAADCAEGVCLELVPWDLGLSRHREDEVVWGGVRDMWARA
jgi:hypothetical protein